MLVSYLLVQLWELCVLGSTLDKWPLSDNVTATLHVRHYTTFIHASAVYVQLSHLMDIISVIQVASILFSSPVEQSSAT